MRLYRNKWAHDKLHKLSKPDRSEESDNPNVARDSRTNLTLVQSVVRPKRIRINTQSFLSLLSLSGIRITLSGRKSGI